MKSKRALFNNLDFSMVDTTNLIKRKHVHVSVISLSKSANSFPDIRLHELPDLSYITAAGVGLSTGMSVIGFMFNNALDNKNYNISLEYGGFYPETNLSIANERQRAQLEVGLECELNIAAIETTTNVYKTFTKKNN